MGFSHEHMLFGDIGATNARFALMSNGVLGPINWFTVAEFPRFTDAVNAFLDCHCRQLSVLEALLAVAGPVEGDRCVLTNCPWTIDAPELCAAFRFAKVHIFNDFEATALSLPHLTAADLYPLGGGEAVSGAPMAVKARLLSRARAVTRLWRLPPAAKMRSSTICAGSSGTCRRSE